MTTGHEEKREYFRCSGTVFLYYAIKQENPSDGLQGTTHTSLDPIGLKIMNYRARLDYNQPEHWKYLSELCEIIEAMYAAIPLPGKRANALPKANKQAVIISGGGIQFFNTEMLQPGQLLGMTITFPTYPNESVFVNARVLRCHPHGNQHLIACQFENMSDTDQELIIKFVNYLQRQKLSNSRPR